MACLLTIPRGKDLLHFLRLSLSQSHFYQCSRKDSDHIV